MRVRADLLLIDMEIDGEDHVRPEREERDERRDTYFAEHGWYTARLWMPTTNMIHWQRDLVRDLRRLMRVHEEACQVAHGSPSVSTPAR